MTMLIVEKVEKVFLWGIPPCYLTYYGLMLVLIEKDKALAIVGLRHGAFTQGRV